MPQGTNAYAATLPSLATDGTTIKQATTQFGDLRTTQLMDSHSALVEAGCYYRVCTDPATTSPGNASVALYTSAAHAVFLTVHNRSAAEPKRIFLDYIKFFVTGGTAAATSGGMSYDISTYWSDRYSSGSTAAQVLSPVNANTDFGNNSAAVMRAGTLALLGTTGIGAPVLARGSWKRNAVGTAFIGPIVGDIYIIDFGDHAAQPGNMGYTTTPAQYVSSVSPIMLRPQEFMSLQYGYTNAATTSALTMAVEIGWWER